jgi:hypothetical protein
LDQALRSPLLCWLPIEHSALVLGRYLRRIEPCALRFQVTSRRWLCLFYSQWWFIVGNTSTCLIILDRALRSPFSIFLVAELSFPLSFSADPPVGLSIAFSLQECIQVDCRHCRFVFNNALCPSVFQASTTRVVKLSTMSGKRKGGCGEKKPVSSSSKYGLQFPGGRIDRYLNQGKYSQRVGAGAPVYLTAVLKYLCAEILELAGHAARANKKSRILPITLR